MRESAEKFYRNIDPSLINVILIASGDKILPEIGNLGIYAKKSLEQSGVTFYINTRLNDINQNIVYLSNNQQITSNTVIWAGGNTVHKVIKDLDSEHNKSGRIVVDNFLRLKNYPEVYALGDCSQVIDSRTNIPYPPTAQHAIREARTVAENLFKTIKKSIINLHSFMTRKAQWQKLGKKME